MDINGNTVSVWIAELGIGIIAVALYFAYAVTDCLHFWVLAPQHGGWLPRIGILDGMTNKG